MKYLKVFVDFAGILTPLSDNEKGRLFEAMLKYAECEREPEFSGNERFVWQIAKQEIDRSRQAYEQKVENARSNGRKRGSGSKTESNRKQPKATESNRKEPISDVFGSKSVEDKDKDKEKIMIPHSGFLSESEMETAVQENAITNSTIYDLAENYGIGTSYAQIDKLRSLSEEYGMDKLRDALDTAAESSKGVVSLAYVKAILLNNRQKKKPSEQPKPQKICIGEDEFGNLIYR